MDLTEHNARGGDPSRHWYYISKSRAIKALIGPEPVETILDVGGGAGVISRLLVEAGAASRAICVDPAYEEDFIGARRTDRVAYRRSIESVDAPLILMIDVLEHVEDDVALIADYARRAAPGTRFIFSAPAFDFLTSPRDKRLERRRRYTLARLKAAVEAAGLETTDLRYFFGFLFPAATAVRVARRMFGGGREASEDALAPVPDWANETLVAIHDVERAALFPFNRLAGVSAFCVARKPAAMAQKAAAA